MSDFLAPGDFSAIVNMLLTIPAGQTSLTFPLPTQDDNIAEIPETFGVFLTDPRGGVILGNNFTASVNIVDNDGVLTHIM